MDLWLCIVWVWSILVALENQGPQPETIKGLNHLSPTRPLLKKMYQFWLINLNPNPFEKIHTHTHLLKTCGKILRHSIFAVGFAVMGCRFFIVESGRKMGGAISGNELTLLSKTINTSLSYNS